MIKGIGCDITDVTRIERLLKQPRFLQKTYTQQEQKFLAGRSAQTAAGLWAAKEAVSKALGTGFVGFSLQDIEICHAASGQPYVRLYGAAKDLFSQRNAQQIHLTISHEHGQAIAFSILE